MRTVIDVPDEIIQSLDHVLGFGSSGKRTECFAQ